MAHINSFVYILFSCTVFLSAWLFIMATNYSKTTIILISGWAILQSVLGLLGFYNNSISPQLSFPFLIAPPVIFLASCFFTRKGKMFIDGLNLKALTLFHTIRIPVEITLLFLFLGQTVPEAMTFEGRNFDMLSGLTPPVMYYLVFRNKTFGRKALLIWNAACILLLWNVVSTALCSLPNRYQHFGFEQPNIAVGFFTFLLLPAFVVPLALFSNAAAIRKLCVMK